jgi:hypothetical protein
MTFSPKFTITPRLATCLMRIEAAKQAVLDPRQRKALQLFRDSHTITSSDVAALFGISQRAARNLLTAWVGVRFLVVADPAKKSRKYGLAMDFREILD